MSDNQVTKKHLPTGDEPPKGYETLIDDKSEDRASRVDFVMYKHLAKSERSEIEALRERALESVVRYIGLTNEPLTLEREVNIIEDMDESNKMFVLAFIDKKLVGYSLVVTGWPEPGQWLIQHMIIDPSRRGQGIGTTIVKSIEQNALESEIAADSIFAIPVQESGKKFWQDIGYTVEAARFLVSRANVDHEIVVYHKEL